MSKVICHTYRHLNRERKDFILSRLVSVHGDVLTEDAFRSLRRAFEKKFRSGVDRMAVRQLLLERNKGNDYRNLSFSERNFILSRLVNVHGNTLPENVSKNLLYEFEKEFSFDITRNVVRKLLRERNKRYNGCNGLRQNKKRTPIVGLV